MNEKRFTAIVIATFNSDGEYEIFYNPISLKLHSNNTYKPDSNYVVFAGRLTESKGIEELIEAWSDVGFNDLSLKVLGDGELYTELTSKYINKNIEFTQMIQNIVCPFVIIFGISLGIKKSKKYRGGYE